MQVSQQWRQFHLKFVVIIIVLVVSISIVVLAKID